MTWTAWLCGLWFGLGGLTALALMTAARFIQRGRHRWTD